MMSRQEAAASNIENRMVLRRPNLPIRYIQLNIPGREIRPGKQDENIIHTSLHY
jgi:hypothetical protein